MAAAPPAADTAVILRAEPKYGRAALGISLPAVAKDTEKLIRQLSLVSFLMASGRPVTALEIKRDVEGYSSMNEDAFARRFYADRAELENLGISLQVDRPAEGFFEAELYSLPPENYYLDMIEFTDGELEALRSALELLDGEFAYVEPLRLALQQVAWGRNSDPVSSEAVPIDVKLAPSGGGREVSQRLAKIEAAISRRKTIEFSYYTLQSDETADRKVDPYHLVLRDGHYYLIGHSHERDAVRVFRLSRIRGKIAYATKSDHDFTVPDDFDRSDYVSRSEWQMGTERGSARVFVHERIAWLVERDFGRYGTLVEATPEESEGEPGLVFETEYGSPRQLLSWVLGWRSNARFIDPPELAAEHARRLEQVQAMHEGEFEPAAAVTDRPAPEPAPRTRSGNGRTDTAVIRPERFARLVTLAGVLINAAGDENRPKVNDLLDELGISAEELISDLAVLNVVNFGGGTYVLYAEIDGDEIEIDADTYGDNFARPARLLPLEAKALVAAIDLFGDHLPQSGLTTVREKIVAALGHDPANEGLQVAPPSDNSGVVSTINQAISSHTVLELDYYKENEDEFVTRRVEPYRLVAGPEGWYLGCYDLGREDTRHFRLDRMRSVDAVEGEAFEPRAEVAERLAAEGWLAEGRISAAPAARIWVSPERARWLREERNVLDELVDGAVIVEVPYGSVEWLVRETLRGAGDLVVLDPPEVRAAVAAATSTPHRTAA